MLSQQENELYTSVGPDSLMGRLLRYYWHPVCAADELLQSPFRTKEVKVLGEELVVYRDRSGTLGIVDKYCTHRRASLAYGVVEENGIRCQYHGWKFDESGRCIEQPFEDTTHPEDNFRDKCAIRAYKVEEQGGLVFAYLGPEPAPLMPRWGPLVWENSVRDIAITHLPCNWLQCQENFLDSVHSEHLHDYAKKYFIQVLNGEEPAFGKIRYHTKIQFDPFEHGIIKRRVTVGMDESHPEWRIGHVALWPNILWNNGTMQFRVPIDERNTRHFSLYVWRGAPDVPVPAQDVIPSRIVPLLNPETGLYNDVHVQFNQDYLCWATQGDIARRDLEKLGASDQGIILFRKMIREQLDLVQEGIDPSINVFRDAADNDDLEYPRIPQEGGRFLRRSQLGSIRGAAGQSYVYTPSESGYSRDAREIEAAMATWANWEREAQIALSFPT